MPWQQVVDLGDLVVRDAGEGVCEPCVGVDGIELCGLDQSVGDCRSFAACFEADEEVELLPNSWTDFRLS